MEQLANSIIAAKCFDDVTAIMRAEIGDEEIDSRVGPWDPNSATFSVNQWERDCQTYNALIETMRDRGSYTPSPIILQVARHAATLYVAKHPGKPLGAGHREFWSSPWDFYHVDQPDHVAVRFCAFDLEDDEGTVTNAQLPAVRDYLAMLREAGIDQSVIDYLITDITRNNATILRALGYEKEASEIEADGTAYEEEEAELAD